ncbi:MAG TPA: hypothetical protein V6C65_03995 [Allocoleopsis sp.]
MSRLNLSPEAIAPYMDILGVFSDELNGRVDFEPAWLDFDAAQLDGCKELQRLGYLENVPDSLELSQVSFNALVVKLPGETDDTGRISSKTERT